MLLITPKVCAVDVLPNSFTHLFLSVTLNDYRVILDDVTQFVNLEYCLPMYFS